MLTYPSEDLINELKSACIDRGIIVYTENLGSGWFFTMRNEKTNEYIGQYDTRKEVLAFIRGMEYHAKLKSEVNKE